MNLDQLITRLTKAVGGDRALADEVLFACGWTQRKIGKLDNPTLYWQPPGQEHDYFQDGDQPNPLASIDAALTLKPDGAEYSISTLYGEAVAEMPLNGPESFTGRRKDGNVPMAICIAALLARQSLTP